MKSISTSNNYNHAISIETVVGLYNSGLSVKAIAEKFGVSRNVILVRLEKAGITQRNRSESMYLRMSQTSIENKRLLVSKANEGMRNASKDKIIERLKKSAKTKSQTLSKVGILEQYFIEEITKRGFNCISQFPFDVYNIDIAVGNIAIEIHNSLSNPDRLIPVRKRIINLLKGGWTPVYVKFRYNTLIDKITFDKLISLFKQSSSNPSFIGHYWVIGSTGETISVGRLDGDNITNINISESPFNML